MFFFGLIIFLVSVPLLPWYGLCAIALGLGFALHNSSIGQHLVLGLTAGIAQAALAFYLDGRNYGLISQRMGGLFNLPSPYLIFFVMFLWAFLSVFLWLRTGLFLRQLYRKSTV